MHEALALVVGGARQLRPLDAGLLRETLQRARRLTVGVERDVDVRPEHFRRLLGLFAADCGQQHRQASRCVERLGVAALDGNAAAHEAIDDAIEQRLRQAGERLHRQFFGAQFDQQRAHRVGGHHAVSAVVRTPGNPRASRCA